MKQKDGLGALIGKELGQFRIIEMTEVFLVNEDGKKTITLGYFRNKNIAEAFAGLQTDSIYNKTASALVLTNGTEGYIITQQDPAKLFDDEAEVLEIRKKAIAKLTPAERKLLGFE